MPYTRLLLLALAFLVFGIPQGWAQQSALLVSGEDPGSINGGDAGIQTALQSLGFTVTIKGGPNTPVSAADAANVDLVFISSTVTSTNIGNMFTNVNKPVIVSESYLLDDMGMTGPVPVVDYGVANNVSQLEITDPNHPIAQSISGTVSVTTANTSLRWGSPANAADKIARINGSTNRYAIFAYDAGDNMVSGTAPAPRIGFFYDDWTATHGTNQASTLFNQTVQYATSSLTCNVAPDVLKIDPDTVFLVGGSASATATPQGQGNIPANYSVLYLLVTGNNQVIQQTSASPTFNVTATGHYAIHSLVYIADPNDPDYFDTNNIVTGSTTLIGLVNHIAAIGICAAVDLAGDDFTVLSCTADAGTLTIDQNPVFLQNGSASISATPDGNIHVPPGYSTIFVLTSGSNLVIEAVNATPDFTVNSTGTFTIHTLVYDGDPNSPNFLDLSVVQFGTTTGGDVLGLVTANGLCASLDVAGAPVHVQSCTADAGTLTIDQDPVFLQNGSAMISATPDGNINVPAGYSTIFVLTSGSNLVIEAVNATPDFTVNSTGTFTIHTLVYDDDPNSSNFLDLSVVQFGTTTGGDVLGLVTANGLCASLDVAGAPVHVQSCTADAGTLTIDQDPVFLQ
ncbi:MAG: hypothetical protein AAFP92_22780, partial [Bacteroidota bacterium]